MLLEAQDSSRESGTDDEKEPLSEPFSMRVTKTERRAIDFLADLREVDPAAQLLRSMSWKEIVCEYRRLMDAVRGAEAV